MSPCVDRLERPIPDDATRGPRGCLQLCRVGRARGARGARHPFCKVALTTTARCSGGESIHSAEWVTKELSMHTVQSKKNKLNLQIRGLGQASQPVVESDLAALSESDLEKILGGEG